MKVSAVPLALTALCISACTANIGGERPDTETETPPTTPPPTTPPPTGGPVDGAAVYAAECAVCHGPEGRGSGTNPSLRAESEFGMRHANLSAFPRLVRYNDASMPFGRPTACVGTRVGSCGFEVSRYIYETFLGQTVDEAAVTDENGDLMDLPEVKPPCVDQYAARQIKLLARHEVKATLESLLGVTVDVAGLPSDFTLAGFTTQVNGVATQPHVQAYFELSQRVAVDVRNAAFGGIADLSAACAAGTGAMAQCQTELLDGLGRRLFRRALTAEERADYAELLPLSDNDTNIALELTLSSLINAPVF